MRPRQCSNGSEVCESPCARNRGYYLFLFVFSNAAHCIACVQLRHAYGSLGAKPNYIFSASVCRRQAFTSLTRPLKMRPQAMLSTFELWKFGAAQRAHTRFNAMPSTDLAVPHTRLPKVTDVRCLRPDVTIVTCVSQEAANKHQTLLASR